MGIQLGTNDTLALMFGSKFAWIVLLGGILVIILGTDADLLGSTLRTKLGGNSCFELGITVGRESLLGELVGTRLGLDD